MTCQRSRKTEQFEDYLLGRMPEEEQAAFELHYFACDECLALLETMRAVQAELASGLAPAATVPSSQVRLSSWRVRPLAIAAGIGAIVVAGGLFLWEGGRRSDQLPAGGSPPLVADAGDEAAPTMVPPGDASGETPAAGEKPGADEAPRVAPRRRSLAQLAQFTPPPYLALTLRGGEAASVDDAFTAGMQRYMGRDYAGAREALTRAVAADPGRPAAQFYLGICQLHAGEAEAAAASFARTVSLGDSIYYEDAHFFLAKARLAQGRVADARAALQTVATLAGDREADARALLRELAGR